MPDDPILRRRQQRERAARRRTTAIIVAAGLVAGGSLITAAVMVAGRKRERLPEEAKTTPAKRAGSVPIGATPPEPSPPVTTDLRNRVTDPPFLAPSHNPFFPPPVPVPETVAGPPPPEPEPEPEPRPEPDAPFKSDRPAKEAFAGYYLRTVAGFKVYVSRLAYENSDDLRGEPLKVVDDELALVAGVLPPDSVKGLRAYPIWVEWDHTRPQSATTYAVYYGSTGEGLLGQGVDPRKAECVCILSMKTALSLKKAGGRRNTLLHELAHVVHAKVYIDNPFVRNAYEQAAARGLYARLRHDDGYTRAAYAARNEYEYFAELTCAYFDRLDYPPHDRKELREFDSVGYEMMTKAWGTPEKIAELKKKAAGRSAPKRR